jgi:hypothetical protein
MQLSQLQVKAEDQHDTVKIMKKGKLTTSAGEYTFHALLATIRAAWTSAD